MRPRAVGMAGLLAAIVMGLYAVPSRAVGIPSVSVPSVNVPSVWTPIASTPSVSTPSISTPSVSAPPLSAPSGTPAPVKPTLSTVTGTASSVGSSTGEQSGANSGSAGGTYSGPSARTAGDPASNESSSSGRSRSPTAEVSRLNGNALQLAVHRAVARLSGCLTALAPSSQRLLVLAAGYGSAQPLSVEAVARSLHMPASSVVTRERGALASLLSANDNGGCSGAPGVIPVTALPLAPNTLVLLGGTQPGPAPLGVIASRHRIRLAQAHRPARLQLLGRSVSRQAPQHPRVLAASLGPTGTGSGLGAPVIAVLVLAGLGILTILARHRAVRREPAVTSAPTPVVFAAAAPTVDPPPATSAPDEVIDQPEPLPEPVTDPGGEHAPVPIIEPPTEPRPKRTTRRNVRTVRRRWQLWAGVMIVVAGAAVRELIRAQSRRSSWARRLRRR